MIILLYGADELGMRRRLDQVKADADGGSGMLATNHTVVDGRDAKPPDVIAPAMAVPFLAPQRLVVVENLLERYEAGPGEQRQPRSLGPWEPLLAVLTAGIPDTTVLVFVGAGVTSRNPMVERLRKLPGVLDEHYPELKGPALTQYIRQEGTARGIRFRAGPPQRRHVGIEEWEHAGLHGRPITDPVDLLRTLLQGDTLGIANELDKLALYSAGREVTMDDVFEVCAGAREFDTFAFTDAVMDGRLDVALNVMKRLREDGLEDGGLLALLLSAYRRLASVVDLVAQGASPEQIGAAMGAAGKYANLRDKAINRARGLGVGGLRRAYELMVEADRTNKLGEVDEELALDVVVMRLAALAPQAAAGRR